MQSASGQLLVHEAGPKTLIGFRGNTVPDDEYLLWCRGMLRDTLARHKCRVVTFDLSNLPEASNALLGLMYSLSRLGVQVQIYGPTPEVQHILKVTRLDRVLRLTDDLYSGTSAALAAG